MAKEESNIIEIKVDSKSEVWVRVRKDFADLIKDQKPRLDPDDPDCYLFRADQVVGRSLTMSVNNPPCFPPNIDDGDDDG